MLETTRAFALECLASHGDTARVMRRHAEVVRASFERYRTSLLQGVSIAAVFAQFAPDLDNLRGALRWALETDGRVGVGLLGTAGATYYLDWMQLAAEGWRWCQAFRPFADEAAASDAARFWLACAELGTEVSVDESIRDADRAIAMYRDIGDQRGLYQAWNALLYSLMLAGRFDDAMRAYEQARSYRDDRWPAWFRAILPNRASMLFSEAGHEDDAREQILEQLALDRQCCSASGEMNALCLLVDLDVQIGHAERAVETARTVVASYRPDLGFDSALSLRNCATALVAAGAPDDVDGIYRDALTAARRHYGSGAFVLDDMATLLARRGRIDDAARVSAYAECVYARLGRRPRLVARRNRERLLELLSKERSPDALAKLFDEGRRLTEDEACAVATRPTATS
jgi:pentatricopeptide repeat protein